LLFATQVLIVKQVAILWLVAVVSGCLGLFGINFSTLSAHPRLPQSDLFHAAAGAQGGRSASQRGRRGPSSPGTQTGDDDRPWASYSRYSSDYQREESISDQQRKCREAAARDGHTIAPELEFKDEAVSGTKLHREGLDDLLAAAEAGRFCGLYFYNLSRLARESVISMPLLKKLAYINKVRIISVTEGIDSDRDGWDVVATIFSVVHERFIKDLSDNVFKGQEGTVLDGHCVGDYCFGYRSVPIPGSEQGRKGRNAKPRMAYEIDPETAPWVVHIFNWFVVDMCSIRWITRELNRLNAPKDHRATTKYWHHQQVTALLKRKKYIGIWPWGEKKNVRNPLTGQVSQEDRCDEDCAQWTRTFPHLRIVTSALWEAAQARLAANERQQEHRRRPNGRLAGSRTGNSALYPRHLLSGLLRCEACGARFQVAGPGAQYLRCPNYAKGVCTCQTQVRRDRAERMIVKAIGQRILSNSSWKQVVFEETLAAWKAQGERRPDEIQTATRALAEVDHKIGRLVDSIENGNDMPEVGHRLLERRKERASLVKTLEELNRTETLQPPEPTMQWVAENLGHLAEVLAAGGPAAAHALRNLVGGHILVHEIREPGRQRFYMQGKFVIRSVQVLKSLAIKGNNAGASIAGNAPAAAEEIVLDFRDPAPDEQIVDAVKELWDAGLTYREIAAQVGWNRNIVAAALARWHRDRGLEPPDGRSCKYRLERQTLPEKLAEDAKRLWDQDLLMQEIADRLQCNRDTATKAVSHWFRSRGLAIPDGRTRRKELLRK
jgi:site-specific DNA recombinase